MQALVAALAPYGGNGNIAFIASAKHWVRMSKTDLGAKGYPVFVASNLTNRANRGRRQRAGSRDRPADDRG